MMKKTLLFCFVAFAVYHSKAQYSLDASFGNATGYVYLDGLNPSGNTGDEADNCKKLIKLPNGHILAVGSVRYTGDGNDLDIGYFELDAAGTDIAHYQHGTADDEYVTDALVLNNVLYFCGYSRDASNVYHGMIGKIDLTSNTPTVTLLPTAGNSQLNGIATDGASLYFCGQSVEGSFYQGFIMKTDINFVNDIGFGLGGTTYTPLQAGGGHSEYYQDILVSNNSLIICGYTSSGDGGIIKILKTNSATDYSFTPVLYHPVGSFANFLSIAESQSDHSLIVVGNYDGIADGALVGSYNSDGTPNHSTILNPNSTSTTVFYDVIISNNRVVITGVQSGYEYITSLLLPSFTPDSDFNITDGTDHFNTDYFSNWNMSITGQTALIDGTDLYIGGRLENYYILGNTAMAVSRYTSNGAGISENNTNTNFSVFPNPVADELNIESKNQKVESIEILNQIGQVVKSTTNSYSIDCSDLKSGSYFVRVNKNEVSKFNKL
ncbi:MAG: hypothetical protein RLZ33_1615 [Bacteroidota bacterium]|jgi:hypothetical protein